MAKFQYTDLFGKFGSLGSIYDEQKLELDKHHTAKLATYTGSDGGDLIVVEGHGLTYSAGKITGGTIDSVTFENSHGKVYGTMVDGDFGAKPLMHFLNLKDTQVGMERFLDQLKSGDDTVTGSAIADYLVGGMADDHINGGKGGDILYGGRGFDVLHGGAGSDHFLFSPDKDIVDDFDARGGGKNQDYLDVSFDDVKHITTSGHDVVVELDDGSMMTLLDVKRSDITAADFNVLM